MEARGSDKAKHTQTSLTTFLDQSPPPSLLPQDHIIRFAWLGDISTSNAW